MAKNATPLKKWNQGWKYSKQNKPHVYLDVSKCFKMKKMIPIESHLIATTF